MRWRRTLSAAAGAMLPALAGAQLASVALDGRDGAAVLDALARECYEARLAPSMPTERVLDCSGVVAEREIPGAPEGRNRYVVTHRLRFTLTPGAVGAEAWTETEELDTVVEQAVENGEYRARVQQVLAAVVARLGNSAAPVWAGRYESEQAWRLDAHLKAVSHCDANLASMTADTLEAEMRRIGLRALDDGTRDRCEQLYAHLFEWGLARGNSAPTVAEYARYRAALPAEQRLCAGQLALDATCAP